ncbi:MAG: hypothetical protein KAH20_05570 [Methylococcales bacterium]|nr:hypothetical protein [Methylococcales bacterium]
MLQLKNHVPAIIFHLLLSFSSVCQAFYEYTPSDVYTQALKIKQEVEVIRAHLNAPKTKIPQQFNLHFKPRHVWQKSYEIFIKINILRQNHQLPRITVSDLEPVKELDPGLVYEQTQRILAELAIFKDRQGITKKASQIPPQKDKTPADVYHLMNTISIQMDSINGKPFTPSFAFAQSMRVLEDLNTILAKLNIHDRTTPPERKNNVTASDAFNSAIEIIKEIQRLQAIAGVDFIDISTLKKKEITSNDVFNMTGIIISGVQPIKAYLNLNNQITPPANIYSDKQPADTLQILGWILRKFKKIKNLDY